jgi:SpoIID/LytB domain protein
MNARYVAYLLLTSSLSLSLNTVSATEIPTDQAQKNKPATIKVLINSQEDTVLLETRGRYEMYNPLNDILLTQGSAKRQWVTPSKNGLIWGELVPGNFQIRLVPKDTKSTLLVNGIEYRGCVEIHDIRGKLFVVNEVDIERYLKSIMTSQFPSEMDEEVMDAIAVTARTNAYYLIARNPVTQWHVDGKEVGYQGHAVTLQNLHVDRAIDNTRHMVLTYQGVPFPATWTKDSAGKTADFSTVYRKNVTSPQGVEAPFAAYERDKHTWGFSISKKDLAKALGAVRINEIELYQDQHSKKVYGARVKDENQSVQVDFTKLQTALSPTKLKSNDFAVEIHGDQVQFKGFGEGTGVGLCLFSACAMADKGEKAPKILETFFPETKLERKRILEDKK